MSKKAENERSYRLKIGEKHNTIKDKDAETGGQRSRFLLVPGKKI